MARRTLFTSSAESDRCTIGTPSTNSWPSDWGISSKPRNTLECLQSIPRSTLNLVDSACSTILPSSSQGLPRQMRPGCAGRGTTSFCCTMLVKTIGNRDMHRWGRATRVLRFKVKMRNNSESFGPTYWIEQYIPDQARPNPETDDEEILSIHRGPLAKPAVESWSRREPLCGFCWPNRLLACAIQDRV